MMGAQETSARLFYDFCLDDHVPSDHILRSIDWHRNLDGVRQALKPLYSSTGRPSIDPELMIRMLIVGYCMGIRSERRLYYRMPTVELSIAAVQEVVCGQRS